ncbi:MAG: CvpA family protein [Ruminococcaceae bacterium]|nr:CvpA family protein [Oscillospiraceae bacterium]
MFKKYILPGIIALVVGLLYFYIALPAINVRDGSFWFMLFLIAVVYAVLCFKWTRNAPIQIVDKKIDVKSLGKKLKIGIIVAGSAFLIISVAIVVSSSKLFNAFDYQKMLTVTEAEFSKDIAEIPFSKIPVVDRSTAERLGSTKLGEVVELVSQFNVSDYYTQINYKEAPYRVSPLQYNGILKWLTNQSKGIPYYVMIDMATQNTELVKLEEGIKYSPSEFFFRYLDRHVRFAYPTKIFAETSFEINDEGHPYWVLSYYKYTIGFIGGKDIDGIILVDAVTGEMTDYKISKVPTWIDRVYSADLVLEQANNWGSLKNGYWNSIFAQKNVVQTSEGYNYLALNDDVWLFTGITSVASDNSNIGFILVNMRTKESKTYSINGASEYSAMDSAEGMIQEKGYEATFPILVNVADKPSYFISLKDNAGLVKAYSFVSVSNYQIVGVADTIEGAEKEYRRLLGAPAEGENNKVESDIKEFNGVVDKISSAVVNGNSIYYMEIGGSIYIADINTSIKLPFVQVGDTISGDYIVEDGKNVVVLVK